MTPKIPHHERVRLDVWDHWAGLDLADGVVIERDPVSADHRAPHLPDADPADTRQDSCVWWPC